MKKKIILLFVALAFFITFVSPIQAAQESSAIPAWFSNAIQPIKDILTTLISKMDNHEARIAELEKKVDFNLPDQWGVSFYEDRFTMNTPSADSPSGTISLPLPNPPNNNCRWKNAVIDSDTSARAIAHLNTGDIYGAGSCRGITFRTSDLPPSGSTFETDVYVFWQGTEKHAKQTITVPDRPFPKWGSLLISPSNNVEFTQGTGGVLYYQNNPIGIGTTPATQQLIIDCGVYNCSDLWKISN